jgi:hypothetical protein
MRRTWGLQSFSIGRITGRFGSADRRIQSRDEIERGVNLSLYLPIIFSEFVYAIPMKYRRRKLLSQKRTPGRE